MYLQQSFLVTNYRRLFCYLFIRIIPFTSILENLKRDVLNLDIAGFKASINNTNTTQNKQLQTLFEGIDALKKEACQHTLTGQF